MYVDGVESDYDYEVYTGSSHLNGSSTIPRGSQKPIFESRAV